MQDIQILQKKTANIDEFLLLACNPLNFKSLLANWFCPLILHTNFVQQITSEGKPLLLSFFPGWCLFTLSKPILWTFAAQCRSDNLSLAKHNVHSCVPVRVCGCLVCMCESFETACAPDTWFSNTYQHNKHRRETGTPRDEHHKEM